MSVSPHMSSFVPTKASVRQQPSKTKTKKKIIKKQKIKKKKKKKKDAPQMLDF